MCVVVSVPLDEVLNPTIPDPGVKNPFDLIVVFTIYDDRVGCSGLLTTREGIRREGEEFDDREDGMKTAHGFREFEAICAVSDRGFNLEGSKADAVEFLAHLIGPDIRCVQENHVPRFEDRSQVASSIVVPRVLVLSLDECCLRFLQPFLHPVPEGLCILIHNIHIRFKTHPRVPARIRDEGSDLS